MHRFSLVCAFVLALTACTPGKHAPAEDADGQSSFYVESVKGDAERGPVTDSAWRVPTAVDFSLQVCLRDRTSRKELINQKFFVAAPGSTVGKNVETNVSGCFPYTDSLPFNFFAGRSGWVSVKREVIGTGTYSGRRTIDLAINPWAVGFHPRDSGGRGVVFLRDGIGGFRPKHVIDGQASVNAFLAGDHDEQTAAKLIIQDLRIKPMPESERTGHIGSRYMIEMHPRIQSQKFNGDLAYDDVQDGEFDVEMQLLSVNTGANMDQKVLILDPGIKAKDVGRVIDGQMRTEIMIDQDIQANQGNLELALRITPRTTGLHATIQPFNSLYRLGPGTMADGGSGWQSMKCDAGNACDFDTVIRSAVNFGQSHDRFLEGNPYFQRMDRYVFSNIKLGFFMVKAGETATQRTIMYTASTCITDKYTREKLANTPMIIRYLKQKKLTPEERKAMTARGEVPPEDQHDEIEKDVISKSTDASGCLNWDGLVYHKYYKPEQYFERNIEIEKPSGFKQSFSFILNPWDTNIYFGRDKRELTSDNTFQEIKDRKKVISRFFVGSYSYHTVRFLYNIDPFMELEVKKTVLLELGPEVLRYSGIKDARKMTEHLRDGIYLMKLGIQKSYLDPRDNSGWLLGKTARQLQSEIKPIGPERLATRNFVTTNQALVRVVDGEIIYPVELTMRDLRLMRVRSNFLIQLQTVDERLIQAYHKFKDHAIEKTQLEAALNQTREELKDQIVTPTEASADATTAPGLVDLVANREKSARDMNALGVLQRKADDVKTLVGEGVSFLRRQLTNGGVLGTYLNSAGQSTNIPFELTNGALINDSFQLDPNLLLNLKKALAINDFSELKLPKSDEIDLNLFVEEDSGLEPRTFVGPVIFLSNAYSDSVRATDNLDEEQCTNATHERDAWAKTRDFLSSNDYGDSLRAQAAGEVELNHRERAMYEVLNDQFESRRQNNAYQHNQYFGSLSHLCYKSVDELQAEEKHYKKKTNDLLIASSLKNNFIHSYNFPMDFVSLTNEPLIKVADGCTENIGHCLTETTENVLPASRLGQWINHGLREAHDAVVSWPKSMWHYFRPGDFPPVRDHWRDEDLGKLFYERNAETAVGICNLLANRASNRLGEAKLLDTSRANLHAWILNACSHGGLVHDLKYHIEQTGDYTFLGGLNLNLNVSDSFSMSWSHSWGTSGELSDFIGFPLSMDRVPGWVPKTFLKPFNLKVNNSMSNSNGTSISEQTYLVSQVAKFDVDLLGYEKCAIVRLSDSGFEAFKRQWWLHVDRSVKWRHPLTLKLPQNDEVEAIMKSGLMVCEGSSRKDNPKLPIEEMYFYFTQHFTEGDMLDQAELYNHPWLLAMRGMRDFNVFVSKIRAQQEVGRTPFPLLKGVFLNQGYTRPRAWALDHMSKVYAQVLPSFPGYYTVVDKQEDGDVSAFLLQQSRSKWKKSGQLFWEKTGASDPNGEVIHPHVGGQTSGAAPR